VSRINVNERNKEGSCQLTPELEDILHSSDPAQAIPYVRPTNPCASLSNKVISSNNFLWLISVSKGIMDSSKYSKGSGSSETKGTAWQCTKNIIKK